MSNTPDTLEHKIFTRKTIEATIRIAILVLLIGWCFAILAPFVLIFAWAMILAIAVYPLFEHLQRFFKGRKKIAATLLTLLLLAVILIPTALITESLVSNISLIRNSLDAEIFYIPPPAESVREWPLIGQSTYSFWMDASTHLEKLLTDIAPQLKVAGMWLLNNIGSAGFAILQFVLSIIICGIMLNYSEHGKKASIDIGNRLIGPRGEEFVQDTIITIKNVAKGILGVAFLQAVLFGLGLIIAGVPYAGVWAIICLILAIIQIGIFPVTFPIAVYLFMTQDILTAVFLTIWMILVSLLDNVLKPIIMGRKAPVPTLVIFLGAIGGFMLNGIIGLFVGAVVLSIGYKIYMWWLNMDKETTTS